MHSEETLAHKIKVYWANQIPGAETYFKNELISSLIKSCDIATQGHPERPTILFKFITGMVFHFIHINLNEERSVKKINDLVQPGFDLIFKIVKSDSYKSQLVDEVITGDRTMKIETLLNPSKKIIQEIKVSKKEILNFIKRNDEFPLIYDDIEKIQKKWENKIIHQNVNSDNEGQLVGLKTGLHDKQLRLLHSKMGRYMKVTLEDFFEIFSGKPIFRKDLKAEWIDLYRRKPNKTTLRAFLEFMAEPFDLDIYAEISLNQKFFVDKNGETIKLNKRGDNDYLTSKKDTFYCMIK